MSAANLNPLWALGDKPGDPHMLDGKSSCSSQTDMKKGFAREVRVLGFGSFLNCDCLIFWAFSFQSCVDSFCL